MTGQRRQLMKAKKDSTVKIVLRVPPEVKLWLLDRAKYNAATLGAEVSRACRLCMEAEARAASE
jgi:hypothetical protein